MERGYSLIQASQLLGITVRTAREWVHNGKMKANKITGSRRWIVMESEIKRLQGGQEHEDKN